MSHFNSPHFNEIYKQLTPEQKLNYEVIGQLFFTNRMMDTILIDTNNADNTTKTPMEGVVKDLKTETSQTPSKTPSKTNILNVNKNIETQSDVNEILKMLRIGYDFDELEGNERELLIKTMNGLDNVNKWIQENC